MLLGCIPLAFASAIVRYRLMDIEVIIKKALVVAAVVLLLVVIYGGALQLVGLVLGTDENRSSFWALLATLVVALVAPWLWNAIQDGARSALLPRSLRLPPGARELRARAEQRSRSRSPELSGSSTAIRETLGVDKIALFLPEAGEDAAVVRGRGVGGLRRRAAARRSAARPRSGARLLSGQTVVIDDPLPLAPAWRRGSAPSGARSGSSASCRACRTT